MRLAHIPHRFKLILAFAAVYIIWGSTYLFIRFAIETVPPFYMAATRFLLAGSILFAWARLRGAPPPTGQQWRSAATAGVILLAFGNGALVWAEKTVPTGIASLLIATVPLWMLLMEWLRHGGARPSAQVFVGLALGFIGIGLLIGPTNLTGGGRLDPIGTLAVLGAAVCWAYGSLYSRHAKLPDSQIQATGMEMLGGGAVLVIMGLLSGETRQLAAGGWSLQSLLSIGYLIIFGSIVAFTAYIWLLKVSTPSRVSTYAFVNPVVAVFLGWAFRGEALSARTLAAAAVIVVAVALITIQQTKPDSTSVEAEAPVLPDA